MDTQVKIVGKGTDGYGSYSQLYTWAPKPDITVLELALAMPALIQIGAQQLIRRKTFEALAPEVRRHFTVEETTPY